MDEAKPACEEEGLPYQVVVAQAMVETGWGRHQLCGKNILGIKDNGSCRTQSFATGEEGAGGRYTINSKFCCFDTVTECLQAWKGIVTGGPSDYYSQTKRRGKRFERSIEFACSPPRFLTYLFMSYYASGNRYVDAGVSVMKTIHAITGDADFADAVVEPDQQLAGQLPGLKTCHKSNSASWIKIRECRDNAANSWPRCPGVTVDPDAHLNRCSRHPDLVCHVGKSSCDNLGGYHSGNCPGDTWCCKEKPVREEAAEEEAAEAPAAPGGESPAETELPEWVRRVTHNDDGEPATIIEAAGNAVSSFKDWLGFSK